MTSPTARDARPLLAVLLGASIAACGAPQEAKRPSENNARAEDAMTVKEPEDMLGKTPTPAATTPGISTDPVALHGAQAKNAAATAPLVPRVEVAGEKGERLDAAQAAFQPARDRMRECVPGARGVVQVRIQTAQNRTAMAVDPSTSLSGATSRCVLESLSTIDVDEALNRGAPTDRPNKGFTSVVRVEW